MFVVLFIYKQQMLLLGCDSQHDIKSLSEEIQGLNWQTLIEKKTAYIFCDPIYFPSPFSKPIVYYSIYKRIPMCSNMSQFNPVNTFII
jgi:hypothetical protein